MKTKLLNMISCFTAAAVISNVLIAGNLISASAMRQSQITNENAALSLHETDSAADADTGNHAPSSQEPDSSADADTNTGNDSQKPQTPDSSGDSTTEDSNTGDEPKEPDSSENPDRTDTSPKEDDEEEPKIPKLEKPVLKAASKPNGTIKLSWKKVKGAAEYVLLCSTKKDSGFHRIYAAENGVCRYKDSGREAGRVYYYKLAVFSEGRASRADSRVVAVRSLKQVELTGISNLSGSRNLVIQWNAVEGADKYQILRKNQTTGKYEAVGSVKGSRTSYTDHNLNGGTIYSYKVYAQDAAGGRGNYSKAISQMAIDQNKKMIALTYDDGPSAYTPIVLNALAKYGAHATFFVVGNQVDRYTDSVRRAAALGCEIGNHTYAHADLKKLSTGEVQSVVNRTSQAVKNQSGVDVQLLRPPYGSYNSSVSAAAGMPIIMWSIDTLDWKTRSTSATIQCVQQKAYDGAIVLMHDLHHPTAMAADTIVGYLKDAGYQLVTISEMAAYRGGLKKNGAYSQFRK